jgi:anti-sigma regulatory factor (Ser/Thr protein kinase)
MCRAATTGFRSSPSAASDARHWISDHLHRWDIDEVRDTAMLLSSELVTNAVLHASSATEVSMAVVDGALEVSVSDSEPQVATLLLRPRPGRVSRADRQTIREGGRGLYVVAALADSWGASLTDDGKRVWFRLQLPEPAHAERGG